VTPRVAVVGLGLIGGSLTRALSRAGYEVVGVDRPEVLRKARAARVLAATAPRADAIEDVDLVFLAAPPRANRALLGQLAAAGSRAVISDLGSVKAPICREARRLGLSSQFVGGHPMAGTERSGFGASSADLFRDHPWLLTPDGSSPRALRLVAAVVRATGARPVRLPPAEHDRAMAFLSHVPQIVAWALAAAAGADPVGARRRDLAGPGFRDMTRLARSPRDLWREILAENRLEVRRALAALRRALAHPL
jgi:prephenate dehydrogenase